jgi:hypothetical protein
VHCTLGIACERALTVPLADTVSFGCSWKTAPVDVVTQFSEAALREPSSLNSIVVGAVVPTVSMITLIQNSSRAIYECQRTYMAWYQINLQYECSPSDACMHSMYA